jgi:heme/copper-type cytochrome/quinol oxidase subunit 2
LVGVERKEERRGRRGISRRTKWLALIIVLVLLVAAGEYFLSTRSNGTTEVDITIVETNPILQLDHFYPDNLTLALNERVQFAVLNEDDEVRVLTIPSFGINATMAPGEAIRVNAVANQTGTFVFFSPITPPSPVSQGRDGPYLNGTITVTQ